MKKNLFFAALAAVGMVSCSDSDVTVNNGGVTTGDEIVIGMGSPAAIKTRGTGTVGSMDETANKWNNEQIRVIMTNIVDEVNPDDTWGFTLFNTDPIFNSIVTYPTLVPGASIMYDEDGNLVSDAAEAANIYESYVLSYYRSPYTGGVKYYPLNGRSDFFGYHLGGATTEMVAGKALADNCNAGANICLTPATATTAAYMSTLVTIDGSNDLLAGKAVHGDNYVTLKDPDDNSVVVREGFTAALARTANKQPVLDMKHLLTRFTFSITEDATDARDDEGNSLGYMTTKDGTIDGITMNAPTQAELIVAYNDVAVSNVLDLLTWDEDSFDDLHLMAPLATPVVDGVRQEMTDIATLTMNGDRANATQTIGDALFVRPNVDAYTMSLQLTFPSERYNGNDPNVRVDGDKVHYTIPLTIKAPNDAVSNGVFLPGYSYHVNITVHGISEIVVSASIEPWLDGGNIDLDIED